MKLLKNQGQGSLLKWGVTGGGKVDAAVETPNDKECTLGLVWAWSCELGRA